MWTRPTRAANLTTGGWARTGKQDSHPARNYRVGAGLGSGNDLGRQDLSFAGGEGRWRVPVHMADWIEKLSGVLTLNDGDILTHAGRISHEMAQAKAELEYDKFKALAARSPHPVDADFEQATKDLKKLPKPKKPEPPKK